VERLHGLLVGDRGRGSVAENVHHTKVAFNCGMVWGGRLSHDHSTHV
jgi:hypothetical protein